MVKVSVVIPIYNVEDYLGECLDSIINQTLTDIEIICVNDGSKDKSLSILNSYAEKDNRIQVISQENAGHATATNRGMELARGEYLYLMDSDDMLDINALEELYEYSEEKSADFVIFKSMNYAEDTGEKFKSEIYSMDIVEDFIGQNVVNADDLDDLIFSITVTPWSKIYNNNFIKKINARFPDGLIYDDNIFFWEVLFNAERIAFLDKYFFTRRWHSASSTVAGDLRFLDSIKINNLMIDTFKKYDKFDKFKTNLYNRKVNLGYKRFFEIRDEFKEEYYNQLREDFKKFNNKDFIDTLNERNRYIFDNCMELSNYHHFNLLITKFDLCIRHSNGRFDIINEGNADNFVEIIDISDEFSSISYPAWFQRENGHGLVINSQSCFLDFKIKCRQDGELKLKLKAHDVRNENGKRVPVYINYLNLRVNGECIFNESKHCWHNKPFLFEKQVKDSEIIDVHVEWLPFDVADDDKYLKLKNKYKELKTQNKLLKKENKKLNKKLKKESYSDNSKKINPIKKLFKS